MSSVPFTPDPSTQCLLPRRLTYPDLVGRLHCPCRNTLYLSHGPSFVRWSSPTRWHVGIDAVCTPPFLLQVLVAVRKEIIVDRSELEAVSLDAGRLDDRQVDAQ
jgi:hypothetical protein